MVSEIHVEEEKRRREIPHVNSEVINEEKRRRVTEEKS